MESKRRALRTALSGLMWFAAAAAAQGVGGTSGAYLRPPVGAAATALGGAWTAAPDNYAPWWNAAALAGLRGSRLAAGTGMRWFGSADGYGSFEFRVPPRVGMGVMVLYRGTPSLGTLYDLDERPLPSASYTTFTIKTAAGYRVTRGLSIGACVNVLYQSLPLPIYGSAGGVHYASATGIGGFDFAAAYRVSEKWTVGAVLKNVGAEMEWQMGDFVPLVVDRPLPNLTIGNTMALSLAARPLVWHFDCAAYVFGEAMEAAGNAEAVLSTGAEWRGWDNFYIRAGIGDVPVNSSMFRDGGHYSRQFGARLTAGFSYDLSKRVRKGMWVNYAAATNKMWAGIDQQLDVTLSF